MTKEEKQAVTKNAKTEDSASSTKEKVRAGDDVVAYAETHKEASKPAKKEAVEPASSPDMVKGIDRMTGKSVELPLKSIKALSRYIYVHNVFDPTPVIEAVIYKAIAPNSIPVTIEIDEATFEDLRRHVSFKGHVHYNYVDDMAKNDPAKGAFYHRTFHTNYPEWITPEDAKKQAAKLVTHYGPPSLKGIEKVLWPQFTVTKTSLGDVPELEIEDGSEGL